MPRAEKMMKIIHGCNHIQQYGCNTVATIFNIHSRVFVAGFSLFNSSKCISINYKIMPSSLFCCSSWFMPVERPAMFFLCTILIFMGLLTFLQRTKRQIANFTFAHMVYHTAGNIFVPFQIDVHIIFLSDNEKKGVIFQELLWSVKNWISLKSRQNFLQKFYWVSSLHSCWCRPYWFPLRISTLFKGSLLTSS